MFVCLSLVLFEVYDKFTAAASKYGLPVFMYFSSCACLSFNLSLSLCVFFCQLCISWNLWQVNCCCNKYWLSVCLDLSIFFHYFPSTYFLLVSWLSSQLSCRLSVLSVWMSVSACLCFFIYISLFLVCLLYFYLEFLSQPFSHLFSWFPSVHYHLHLSVFLCCLLCVVLVSFSTSILTVFLNLSLICLSSFTYFFLSICIY